MGNVRRARGVFVGERDARAAQGPLLGACLPRCAVRVAREPRDLV